LKAKYIGGSLLESIITNIDAEIARLTEAKALLSGVEPKRKPGRPAKAVSREISKKPKRRTISPEVREKMRQAQIKRWAAAKKSQPAQLKDAALVAPKAKKTAAKSKG